MKAILIRWTRLGTVLALVALAAAACQPAPRIRPVKGDDVNEGMGTITAARKYLLGKWNLLSFEIFPPGKPPVALKGTGTLTYDEYANLKIDINAEQQSADILRAAGIDVRDGVVSTDGRVAVDMQKRTMTYFIPSMQQTVAGAAPGPLALNRPRHWEVTNDVLTLTTKDDAGSPLSVSKWKRVP